MAVCKLIQTNDIRLARLSSLRFRGSDFLLHSVVVGQPIQTGWVEKSKLSIFSECVDKTEKIRGL